MSLLRDIRLLPVVLVAICCLVTLKVAGLLLDGGYILGGDRTERAEPPKRSWAQEQLNFPSGRSFDSEITGSVSAKPKEPPPDTKPAAVAPPVEVIPNKAVSPSERAILEKLQDRRQEIEARAREVDIRESLLKSAEKRIEDKIGELKGTEAKIASARDEKVASDNERLKGLVVMYEGMKPKDAARIFDRLEMPILIEVASRIAPRKMSDIMGQMQSESAERLTVELARRAGADQAAAPAGELPKIEGRPTQAMRN